jgi:hypothetical protein
VGECDVVGDGAAASGDDSKSRTRDLFSERSLTTTDVLTANGPRLDDGSPVNVDLSMNAVDAMALDGRSHEPQVAAFPRAHSLSIRDCLMSELGVLGPEQRNLCCMRVSACRCVGDASAAAWSPPNPLHSERMRSDRRVGHVGGRASPFARPTEVSHCTLLAKARSALSLTAETRFKSTFEVHCF